QPACAHQIKSLSRPCGQQRARVGVEGQALIGALWNWPRGFKARERRSRASPSQFEEPFLEPVGYLPVVVPGRIVCRLEYVFIEPARECRGYRRAVDMGI